MSLNPKIVSLLEMLNFKAHNFVFVCQLLAQIGQVHEFAKLNPTPPLYNLGTSGLATLGNEQNQTERSRKVKVALDVLQIQCTHLGLKFSCKRISSILRDMERDPTWYEQNVLSELSLRLHDELSDGMYFQIEPETALYFDRLDKWQKVIEKNRKLSTDIDEAGKCLATARYTACVFHLMRVMEAGLQLMGKKLKIPGSFDNLWGTIVDDIEKEIEKRWPSKNVKLTASQKRKRSEYHEALSYLKSVRLAWRNEVMHPKETYTEEESIVVYSAVQAFMLSIVSLT